MDFTSSIVFPILVCVCVSLYVCECVVKPFFFKKLKDWLKIERIYAKGIFSLSFCLYLD